MPSVEQLGGGWTLRQDDGFRLTQDTVLLADFARPPARGRACDLGCGGGALGLLLCRGRPALRVDGVEIQPAAVRLARENIARNGLEGRMTAVLGDWRALPAALPAGGYDLVVCNPPYFPPGTGGVSRAAAHRAARHAGADTLEEVCRAAARLLKFGGTLALVHRPEQLCRLLAAMAGQGMEPKRLRIVHQHATAPAGAVLVEGKKGGRPGLALLPPLLLRDGAGAPTAEYRRIYRMDEEV